MVVRSSASCAATCLARSPKHQLGRQGRARLYHQAFTCLPTCAQCIAEWVWCIFASARYSADSTRSSPAPLAGPRPEEGVSLASARHPCSEPSWHSRYSRHSLMPCHPTWPSRHLLTLRVILAPQVLEAFAYYTLSNVLTLHLTSLFGMGDAAAGMHFGLRGALTTVFSTLFGPLIDAIGPFRALPLGFALGAVGRGTFALAGTLQLSLAAMCVPPWQSRPMIIYVHTRIHASAHACMHAHSHTHNTHTTHARARTCMWMQVRANGGGPWPDERRLGHLCQASCGPSTRADSSVGLCPPILCARAHMQHGTHAAWAFALQYCLHHHLCHSTPTAHLTLHPSHLTLHTLQVRLCSASPSVDQ